ncbi:hypothetical protein EV356DRAFT_500828 [Viridothelium virens]|uniref:Uncharacterized protein n=1 Tax=Viridothelium virens TaxID=1048519 RepID=A0A6A6HCK9_VIRVR|nr:hypothetical protein EV356DRAFT_500828 [Viridothelium virens]
MPAFLAYQKSSTMDVLSFTMAVGLFNETHTPFPSAPLLSRHHYSPSSPSSHILPYQSSHLNSQSSCALRLPSVRTCLRILV